MTCSGCTRWSGAFGDNVLRATTRGAAASRSVARSCTDASAASPPPGGSPSSTTTTDAGGAGVRAFQRDINDAINDRFELLERFKKRVAVWIMAKRAKQGIYTLPEDWYKCSFTKPREFTVDDGNARKADREDLRAGIASECDILARRGEDPAEFIEKRAEFLVMRNEIAQKYGLDPIELGTLAQPGDAPQLMDDENAQT